MSDTTAPRRVFREIIDPPMHVAGFDTLAQAVDFIAACIEADSAPVLFKRTVVSERSTRRFDLGDRIVTMEDSAGDDFARQVFPSLRQQHERMDLRVRYDGRCFPADAQRLKLGGHDSELGHIHIDFIRRDNGWVIERIWVCR